MGKMTTANLGNPAYKLLQKTNKRLVFQHVNFALKIFRAFSTDLAKESFSGFSMLSCLQLAKNKSMPYLDRNPAIYP